MADARGEPTMEEILASIRRIIAEDPPAASRAPGAKKSARQAAVAPEPADLEPTDLEPAGPAEPLELTTPAEPAPDDFAEQLRIASEAQAASAEEPQAAGDPEDAPEPVELNQSLTPEADGDLSPEAAAEEEVLELSEFVQVSGEAEGDGILSAATVSAAAERFQQLSQMVVRPEAGSMTLEGLVRELLRPIMKEWLDRNLPDIVDQVVSREVARLTGKGK